MAKSTTDMISKIMVCKSTRYIISYSIWQSRYVLTPGILLKAQLVVISLASKFIDFWLYHLGQTSLVSQIMAGILLGPSLLGPKKELVRVLFSQESRMTLAKLASFGNMFYHFLNAVQTDPQMVLRPGRVAMFMAISVFSITMVLSFFMAIVMKRNFDMDTKLYSSLSLIGMSQAFTGLSVVYYLVNELKPQNTDVGRLTLATAVVTDLLNIIMITISSVTGEKMISRQIIMVWAFITTFAIVILVLFVFRPIILGMIRNTPAGKPVDQKYIFIIIILTLVLGFVSKAIGQHYIFGLLDTFILGFLCPTYLAISGLQTNIYERNPREIWIVGILVLFGIAVKTTTVMMTAKLMNLPTKEAFLLAMVLNSKGIVELTIYNFWKENKTLDFRLLVCIHKPENVPTVVKLLEISHASTESPVEVISFVLVELVGRCTPILISNDYHGSQHNQTSTAARIANALRQYEQNNQGCTNVHSFTSISLFQTMHDVIFRVAIDRRATIVIMPFHKQWAIDGGSANVMTSQSKFNVAIIYLSGPDDAKALEYAARMAKHEHVILTVIRFLLFGKENSQANMGNDRFICLEEVVRDGVGLSQCIGKIVNYFDLILVGRYHWQSNSLFEGLEDWSECLELGVIGDMLASPDFKITASVLVVQQKKLIAVKRKKHQCCCPNECFDEVKIKLVFLIFYFTALLVIINNESNTS
ncbi:hypothetical protein P3X46_014449 [Hevea brasiliensis]|uniref:Cation/H+ exchanger transmembrane domain-containing protein n=1 Tax=Hevea brasiliensis TaxID=3981 RepID=A0ABQ9M8V5_HEVBR|nr:hypothetical protein P3X46_014449 [Hevea brasiliensis]